MSEAGDVPSSWSARVAFRPMFERTALPDGPRVISAQMSGTRALAVAVYVLAGSRVESREQWGVAHFMEHVTFKGTQAYPTTRAVSEAIEGCGGHCNAATDRESTVYWARLPVREAERAFDVLGELVVRPLLRDEDIGREREIIVEEIRSYRDDPAQYVFNIFDEAFYGDVPLGWEIAGDEAPTPPTISGEVSGDPHTSAATPAGSSNKPPLRATKPGVKRLILTASVLLSFLVGTTPRPPLGAMASVRY